jgi:hypothetical protein
MTRFRTPRLLAVALGAALLVSACGGDDTTGTTSVQEQQRQTTVPTVFWLDVSESAVYRAAGPDFDARRIVEGTDVMPDGVAVDVARRGLYWTSMGLAWGDSWDPSHTGGTLQQSALDGSGVRRIVEKGITEVPKQMQVDSEHGHLYWADREGATIWRAQLDGTGPEALVTGHGNVELVGIALDVAAGHVYFGDKTAQKIFRTSMVMPPGQTAADRTDVERLVEFTDASLPIDLAVDPQRRHLYWTDRFNGTVTRAGLDLPVGESPSERSDLEVVVDGLNEPIGLSLDLVNDKLYYGTLGGMVGEAGLDGTGDRKVAGSGSVSGVTVVHLPPD